MQTSPIKISVEKEFSQSAETLFKAFTKPDDLKKWMFGQKEGEEILHIQTDPQEGGSFSFLIRRDGQELDHVGKYLEVSWPKRLAFTWGVGGSSPDSKVSLDFEPQKEGCRITLAHEIPAQWADYADRVRNSWAGMLDALALKC